MTQLKGKVRWQLPSVFNVRNFPIELLKASELSAWPIAGRGNVGAWSHLGSLPAINAAWRN
jgi:hypothetical protein